MMPDDTAIPIACTLDPGSLADRADEWRAFIASSVVALEPAATSVRMVLADSPSALAAAASLGQREKQCCAFFGVSIEIEAERRTLVVRVPDGAEEAMATFVALVTA
jgi:hypothetical protein